MVIAYWNILIFCGISLRHLGTTNEMRPLDVKLHGGFEVDNYITVHTVKGKRQKETYIG